MTSTSETQSHHTPAVADGPDEAQHDESSVEEAEADWYKMATTALNFASFLFSLVVVEVRNSLHRARFHAGETWFGRRQRSSSGNSGCGGGSRGGGGGFHYERVSSDLLKLEAQDALDMRTAMTGAMGVAAVVGVGGLAYGARMLLGWSHG